MGLTLITLMDNEKVSNAIMFLTGEFMKSSKDIKANRLFPEADKDLKIQYCIEEASTFSFRTGSMVGEALDDDKVTWTVLRKSARGYTAVEEADYVEQKIGHFSIKPYVVPISATRAKVTLLVFPLSTEELESQHSHWRKTSFPGLELMQTEVDMFPVVTGETGKRWGCPLVPLLLLGGSVEEHPCIPTTEEIKQAISATLRAAVIPTTKRDCRTLVTLWTTIQESRVSKLKEKLFDLLWP